MIHFKSFADCPYCKSVNTAKLILLFNEFFNGISDKYICNIRGIDYVWLPKHAKDLCGFKQEMWQGMDTLDSVIWPHDLVAGCIYFCTKCGEMVVKWNQS